MTEMEFRPVLHAVVPGEGFKDGSPVPHTAGGDGSTNPFGSKCSSMTAGLKDVHKFGSASFTSFKAEDCPSSTPHSIVVDSASLAETSVLKVVDFHSPEHMIAPNDANAVAGEMKKLDARALHFLSTNEETSAGEIKASPKPEVSVPASCLSSTLQILECSSFLLMF